MADNNIVGSLFGVTPESFQQQRQAQQEAQALRMAQLEPQQLVTYLGARGGQNLGNVASGLLGIEDPQLQAVRRVSEMAKQFDTTTSGGLMQYAQALQQAGLPQYAAMAQQKALETSKLAGEAQQAQAKGALETSKLQQELQFRQELDKLGPNATPEQIINLASRFGGIDKVMGVLQSSLDKQSMLEFRKALLSDKQSKELTPAQKAADAKFGAEYNSFVAGGGISTMQTQLDNLNKAINILETNPNATGKAIGIADKTGTLSYVSPKAAEAKDLVGSVVQSNLRSVLGGQFAQKEGEQLLARAYNTSQPVADNLERLKSLRNQIQTAANAKIQAVQHFEQTGSLKDFKGSSYGSAAENITSKTTKKTIKLPNGVEVTVE